MTITTCILHEHTISAIQTVLCVWVMMWTCWNKQKREATAISHHYSEVRGLSNVLTFQGLIRIQKGRKGSSP